MSVLIEIAMPQNCRECRFMEIVEQHGRERRICIAHLNEITNLKERLDTCPLEELQEQRHGKWETKFTPTEQNVFGEYPILVMRCSVCKTKITLLHEDERIKEKWHYCPNCGSFMGEKNDEAR